MKNEALYKKTVDILVAAYFNNTLEHGDCAKCAVGNILKPIADKEKIIVQRWANLFQTEIDIDDTTLPQTIVNNGEIIIFDWLGLRTITVKSEEERGILEEAHRLINGSGYTVSDLAKIESAFEVADKGNSKDDHMFNGLMAVVSVLDEIHENTSSEITAITKQKFVKQLV